jgi:hypothetical protein
MAEAGFAGCLFACRASFLCVMSVMCVESEMHVLCGWS